ncbi:MAG: dienelactone hydrolase family protein [Thermomicrobiales bacterium]|jgi:carboxymethylenebutenolidase
MCHHSCPKPVTGGAPLSESMTTVSRDDAEIPALLIHPENVENPLPGIVLIHDIWGANDFYHDVARRLANEQYVVALPNLFHREGPLSEETRDAARQRGASARQEDQIADLDAVTTWLLQQEGCDGRYAVIGFCMGGTLAMLLAAREPAPTASVPFYGFPAKDATENAPIRPIDESEVAALNAPVLGIWGEEDSGVGMDNVTAYDKALVRHRKLHDFVVYPDVGHGFLTFDEADAGYETSQLAWHRATAFLEEHFNPEPFGT